MAFCENISLYIKDLSISRLGVCGRNCLPWILSDVEMIPKVLAILECQQSLYDNSMGCGGLDKLGSVTCPNISMKETGNC